MTRLFLRQLQAEQRLFWRSREAAFFTFLLPILFLLLLGSAYGDEEIDGVRGSTYLVAGLLGYGVVGTAFASLAITLVIRRESGVLKRVRGTPLPTGIYLAAAIASILVVIALQAGAQLLVGRFVLDAAWPAAPAALVVVLLLGAVAFAALGLAIAGAVRSAEGSSAVVNAIYLPMAFVSGVFFSVESMPAFLRALAEVTPLTYLLRLVRDAYVAGEGPAGAPGDALVLAGWGAAGVVLALRLFRWEPREA
ncbi:MAG: ABC transporter permease, partial [Thermoleophilia bacterium]|nr:ABC transporter permease [Thermoleophilia bacterium]MDQ3859381.1 ABC transporter permease [Actinomycetota bacterium]